MILTFAEVAEVLGTLWSPTEAPPRETLLLPESGEGKSLPCHFNFLDSGSWLEAGFCEGSKGGKRPPWLKQNTEFAVSCWAGGGPWRTDADNSLPGWFEESDRKKGEGKELERFLGCC